jgi:hypothetical protein
MVFDLETGKIDEYITESYMSYIDSDNCIIGDNILKDTEYSKTDLLRYAHRFVKRDTLITEDFMGYLLDNPEFKVAKVYFEDGNSLIITSHNDNNLYFMEMVDEDLVGYSLDGEKKIIIESDSKGSYRLDMNSEIFDDVNALSGDTLLNEKTEVIIKSILNK